MAATAPAASPWACRIQARVTRPAGSGEAKPPAQRDALGDVAHGGVQVALLVGDLGQLQVCRARGRRSSLTGRGGEFQCLLAGRDGRVQATLGSLELAEAVAAQGGHPGLAGRLPAGDAGGQALLGSREPAS
jgi:hypothetical protein